MRRVRRVVVVGGGSAGFLTALACDALLKDTTVTVIRDPDLGPIGVGESTTPVMPRFLHEVLRLDRKRFYEEVRPSWKLGVRLDWCAPEHSHYYYPFDSPFSERRAGTRKLDGYFHFAAGKVRSPFTVLMDEGRSTCVRAAGQGMDLDQTFAYHIENRPFIQHLEVIARERGVTVLERQVQGVVRDEQGWVTELRLDEGGRLEGDLFVDCTGFKSLLLGREMGEPFLDYARALFCDSAIIGTWERRAGILPYTSADMMDNGWCWRIDLPERVNRGYVFSSAFCDVDTAAAEFQARNPQMRLEGTKAIRFRAGRYRRFWVNNVVAVGNASGFVEPLEATALHMIIDTLRVFVGAIDDLDGALDERLIEAANRAVTSEWDDVRDFIALHYKLNARGRTRFWDHARAETDLNAAGEILALYERCGPTTQINTLLRRETMFGFDGYVSILQGSHAPSRYEFVPSAEDLALWHQYLRQLRDVTSRFLPMDEALPAVYAPEWKWPAPGQFQWTAT